MAIWLYELSSTRLLLEEASAGLGMVAQPGRQSPLSEGHTQPSKQWWNCHHQGPKGKMFGQVSL